MSCDRSPMSLDAAVVEQVGVGALHGETLHRNDLLLQVEDVVAQRALGEPLRIAGLLVGLAVEERHQQEPLVVRQADIARVGQNGVHVVVGRAVVVYQHVVQQVRVGFLVADADRHVVDTVEEQPVLELQRLLLLADVVERAVEFLVGARNEVVADEETAHRDDADQNDERLGDLHERHARRFHRQQLVVLAQVAHRHDGCEQHRERQSHRDHVGHEIGHQLDDDARAQSLAHQLVDIAPHDVHHQDEHHDEEREHHRPQVGFQYEFVDGFHAAAPAFF